MTARYGTPPDPNRRYRLRPGAYAVLPHSGGVLLTYQGHPHFEFQLPGGGIDPGESPLQALHREVFEETGWLISKPRRLGAFRRFGYMPEYDLWAEKLCTIYIAKPTRKIGPPSERNHEPCILPVQDALRVLPNEGDCRFVAGALVTTMGR